MPDGPASADPTPRTSEAGRLGAVILAGGTGARLGGADKASIRVAGLTLLDRALVATACAGEVVVVGDRVDTSRPVAWAREDPPLGGPAAGLLAGLRGFLAPPPAVVLVLAVDMPWVTAETFERLAQAVAGADGGAVGDEAPDGAVLVDRHGRRQPLCAAYRWEALVRAAPARREDERGLPVRRLVGSLRLAEVPAVDDEGHDVDTWADLEDLDRPR